jgi:hypothetical protein
MQPRFTALHYLLYDLRGDWVLLVNLVIEVLSIVSAFLYSREEFTKFEVKLARIETFLKSTFSQFVLFILSCRQGVYYSMFSLRYSRRKAGLGNSLFRNGWSFWITIIMILRARCTAKL